MPVSRKALLAAVFAVLFCAALPAATPAHAADSAFTPIQKNELDVVIHDYLMNNPQVIMDSVNKYRQDQQDNQDKVFQEKVVQNHAALYNDPKDPVTGNKNGDVTMVEFFDYNCHFCKRALKDVQTLDKDDKNLKIVFKDFPILAPSSMTAAQYALAANRQGKYWEFHQAMMDHNGPITDDVLLAVGKSIGLDPVKLKKDAEDPAIRAQIEANLALGREIGINGTPGFVISNDDTVLRGAYGLDAMQKAIADARTKK